MALFSVARNAAKNGTIFRVPSVISLLKPHWKEYYETVTKFPENFAKTHNQNANINVVITRELYLFYLSHVKDPI